MPRPEAVEALFRPRSVAVVGASPTAGSYGERCLSYFGRFGFGGAVHAVNPRYTSIDGRPAYPDLCALPAVPDLAVVLVAAERAVAAVEDAAEAGVPAVVVCTSGFAEAGAAGAALQARLRAVADASGMAILGPNSLGYVDLVRGTTATFTTALEHLHELPTAGPVALVSQSGALAAILFSIGQDEGVGIGKFVSTGNEAVLGFADCIDAMAGDPDVSVVVGYVEGIRDGRALMASVARARARGTQVALVNAGRSESGRRAALSHTGALAGSREAAESAFQQAGVVEVPDLRALLDVAVALPLGRVATGPRVGILSGSGGVGVLMADQCAQLGLQVAELRPATTRRVAEVLPEFAAAGNPLDYGPVYQDLGAVEACLQALLADAAVDAVVAGLALTPHNWLGGAMEDLLIRAQRGTAKPLVVSWLGAPAASVRTLRAGGVAVFEDPSRAVAVAGHLTQGRPDSTAAISGPPREGDPHGTRTRLAALLAEGRALLAEREVGTLLAAYGVPMPEARRAATADEAATAAAALGGTVAVKADAPDLLHKSDAGAVRLDVDIAHAAAAYDDVVTAASSVLGRPVTDVLVQAMAPAGALEVLVGVRHDPSFGPALTVGLGGTFTELLADAVTGLVPVTAERAVAMLDRLRAAPLLRGYRGGPARDGAALARVVVAVSDLAEDAGGLLAEMDLNPVLVYEHGCLVVDAAAVLRDPDEAAA